MSERQYTLEMIFATKYPCGFSSVDFRRMELLAGAYQTPDPHEIREASDCRGAGNPLTVASSGLAAPERAVDH